ncbi:MULTISPECIES: arylsulfotransferase family protein [unclassified Ruegeria]|uniref:arylsulfotransferase family protein n=1 Tax=unclassified Ruegeria TaxID=2625375 RepID=UPI001AE13AAD|nr:MULTISPECIES: arylsulfotransferase family protein [unclassified Ruegeria]
MKRFFEELSARLFWSCLIFTVLFGAVLYGIFAQIKHWPPVPQLRTAYNVLFIEKTLTSSADQKHLQPSRGQGEGVTVNTKPDSSDTILMLGFFEGENQARLVNRNGNVIRKWSLNYHEHFPDAETRPCTMLTPLLTDVHGAVLTPRGDLIFNYEYCGTVKLDQCSNIIWTINEKTHHSLIEAEGGGYLLLSRDEWKAADEPERFPPFSTPATNQLISEDLILRLDEHGEILERFSIPEIIFDSGLSALLTASGQTFKSSKVARGELVHANKIAELPTALAGKFPLFTPGDWAISMRGLNLIVVVDSKTKAVKWYQTGPWVRQHDPEFRPDGKISVFNNNAYLTSYDELEKTRLSAPRDTNIMLIDPVSRETEIAYGSRPGQEMLSVVRGQHEILSDGGMLITEFDAGRVLEVTAEGDIVWEYVNRFDDDFVGEITNSKLYSAEFFQTKWGECES